MNGARTRELVRVWAATFERARDHLGDLDAALGDGDHGAAMARGFARAAEAVGASGDVTPSAHRPGSPGAVLTRAGSALADAMGGASGALFAAVLAELAAAADDEPELTGAHVAAGLARAGERVARLGHARRGDKTMLDALLPATEAAAEADLAGARLADVLGAAAAAAAAGAEASRALIARHGRSRYAQDGGRGHPDPGAASVALLLDTWADVAAGGGDERRPVAAAGGRKLLNHPARLVDDMIDGYVAAYGDLVARGRSPRVVVRARPKDCGKVGIVIGNGSGHEPIAVGWVGEGLLDANAVGEVFAAPSPDLIVDALRDADRGAGVLLLVSRHAGDVIAAEIAVETARTQGLDVEMLLMYDDVSSAPKGREHERRGAPGTAFVYKVVGALAEEGAPLAELVALGERVRDATRTLAAAIAPGVSPLTGRAMFTLPDGEVFLGMGVHGEPGLRSVPFASADALVGEMMPAILDDLPFERGDDVLVFVNGMGGTTLMELLVVHRAVDATLHERGLRPHRPLVGEYVTTQEMAGFSISLCRAEADVRRRWDAPARAPFFHRP